MHISIHNSTERDPAKLSRGFTAVDIHNISDIATYVCNHAWSHCVWRDGIRHTANYLMSDIIALDFDHGMTLDDAKWIFRGFKHIIGTTKSHTLHKNGILCDRFRVILVLSERITSHEILRTTMQYFANKYKADTQAVDAARFFFPCTNIVSINENGKIISLDDVKYHLKKSEIIRNNSVDLGEQYITRNMHQVMEHGRILKGTRDTLCYTIALSMLLQGNSPQEIFAWLSQYVEFDHEFTHDTIYEKINSARNSVLYKDKSNSLTNRL